MNNVQSRFLNAQPDGAARAQQINAYVDEMRPHVRGVIWAYDTTPEASGKPFSAESERLAAFKQGDTVLANNTGRGNDGAFLRGVQNTRANHVILAGAFIDADTSATALSLRQNLGTAVSVPLDLADMPNTPTERQAFARTVTQLENAGVNIASTSSDLLQHARTTRPSMEDLSYDGQPHLPKGVVPTLPTSSIVDMSSLLGMMGPELPKVSMQQIAQAPWKSYDLAGQHPVSELNVTHVPPTELHAMRQTLTKQGFELTTTSPVAGQHYITLTGQDAQLFNKLQSDVYHRAPDGSPLRKPVEIAPLEASAPAHAAAAEAEKPATARTPTPRERLFGHGEWQLRPGENGVAAHLDVSKMQPHEVSLMQNAMRRQKIDFTLDESAPGHRTLRVDGNDARMMMDLQKLHHPKAPSPAQQVFGHGTWEASHTEAGKPVATLDTSKLQAHQQSLVNNGLRREGIAATADAPRLQATKITVEGSQAERLLDAQAQHKAKPVIAKTAQAAANVAGATAHVGRAQSGGAAALKTAQGDYAGAAVDASTIAVGEAAQSQKVQDVAGKLGKLAVETAANEGGKTAGLLGKVLKFGKRLPGAGVIASVAAGVLAVGVHLSRGEYAKAGVQTVASVASSAANILPTGGLSGDAAQDGVRELAIKFGGEKLAISKSDTRELIEGGYDLVKPTRAFNTISPPPHELPSTLAMASKTSARPSNNLTAG